MHQHAGIGAIIKPQSFGAIQAMQSDVAPGRLPRLRMGAAPEPCFPGNIERGPTIVAGARNLSFIRSELDR